MGESQQHHEHPLLHHHQHHLAAQQGRPPANSRLGVLKGAGEIVEVQGGHIVRSTGRKDRHSKVVTAKGPRDRRVRLSAHTAIQFYDVQDRLGYDRPSKAVDWLIKNAKAAIDELAELPPWYPTPTPSSSSNPPPPPHSLEHEAAAAAAADTPGESAKGPLPDAHAVASSAYGFGTGSILPPSLDSDAIADTIKSFFPISATTGAVSSTPTIGFQAYPPDLLSRTGSQGQDLRLSLHSFQDPMLLHHHNPSTHHHQTSSSPEQALFSSSSPALNFDANSVGWSEQHQRMFPWGAAAAAEAGGIGGSGGYVFTVPPPMAVPLHPVLGQSSFFSQRGPLQSSSSPHARAWMETLAADHAVASAATHHMGPSVSAIGFAAGGLSGFHVPARIQGEEENDGMPNRPSSVSPASRH